jgi:adenylosuccinate synthase
MITVVLGLGWGDEGKGHTVAALARKQQATAVVRWSGGPQAAHRVVEKDVSHIFAQFASGAATVAGCKTFLSSQMVIEPLSLVKEAQVHQEQGLGKLLNRIVIDPQCPVATPYHVLLNKARELDRGPEGRIGTVGRGVGEVVFDLTHQPQILVRAEDLLSPGQLHAKLAELNRVKRLQLQSELLTEEARQWALSKFPEPYQVVEEYLACGLTSGHIPPHFYQMLTEEFRTGTVILEGAQGTLLDPVVGSVPNVTKSRTVLSHAQALLATYDRQADLAVGVLRTYAHRHGRGVLPTENVSITQARPDTNNETNEWQGGWRCGYFDAVLAQYAAARNPGLTHVVVTNLDRAPEPFWARTSGEPFGFFGSRLGKIKDPVPEFIARTCGVPLLGFSAGEENAWTWRNEHA